jgi:hypothetical protein
MNFITRKGATEKLRQAMLGPNPSEWTRRQVAWTDMSRRRNYELEEDLEETFGGEWCIAEWCPFNGRFCKVADFIEFPHPPLRGVKPEPPEEGIPWRNFDGRLTNYYRPTDG